MIFSRLNRNIFVIIQWCSLICNILGQSQTNVFYQSCSPCGTNYSYSSGVSEFSISQISSNFDRRELGNEPGSQWHRGIDYNALPLDPDLGFKIKSINELGVVKDIYISPNNQGIGIFTGNNWVENGGIFYYHLFLNAPAGSPYKELIKTGFQVGGFVLKLLDGETDKLAIINLDDSYAIGEIPGTVTFNQIPYTVYNDLAELKGFNNKTIFLGPMGKSQTGNVHLHIEYINSNCGSCQTAYFNDLEKTENPLKYLPLHSSLVKSSNIAIKQNGSGGPTSYPNGIELNYPGTKASSIMAQIALEDEDAGSTYTNHTAAIEEVQYLAMNIGQEQKKYALFAGMEVGDSKLVIGGNPKEKQRYPIDISDNGNIGSFSTGASVGITGMRAFAYSGENFDQYYFSDIYTRRHKSHISNPNYSDEYADFANEASIFDGIWSFKVKARDIRNKTIDSKAIEVNIDNFLPYIHTVKVEAINPPKSKKIYWRNWLKKDPGYSHTVANDGYLESSGVFNGTDYEYPSYYKVTAEASESLEQLTCKINGLVSYGVPANTEKTKWVCDLLGLILLDGNEYTIHFEGKDKSGNSLIKTHALATQAKGQTIINPVRINTSGSNQWSPASNAITGFDEYHKLKITKGCGKFFKGQNEERGADCFAAAFEYQKLPDGYGVQFTNKSEGQPTSYNWDFGDGATSTEVNPGHEYAGPGEYVVVLTAYLNGEKDETSQTIKIDAVSSGGNLEVNILGNTSVALGSHQYYLPQVSGGYPPYTYMWSVDGDFTLGACPAYYSWPYKEEFDAEFKSPGCAVGASGNISLSVTDADNNNASISLPIQIDGEAPSCKLVWSGKPEINSEIDFKIVNNSFLQAIDCKDYYSYFDWYIEGVGNGYYDASYKNILWWLPGYKFAENGVYKVTAKGKKGLYEPYTGEFSSIITIGQNVPPPPPNPPFELFPVNTVEVNFGEQITADPLKNFYLALDYKNPLDQNDNNCGGNKTFDAQGYQFNIKVKSPGTGATNTYYSSIDLGSDQIGNKYPLRGNPNNPIDVTIGPDNYGCNDITVEVLPSGVTCAEYEQMDGFCSPLGLTKLCSTYPGNSYIWSSCFTCPTNGENGKFKNYKYDLPIVIEKKCAFKFDPPQLVVNPASVISMDCGKTYLEANVTGGAPFTTGHYTPNGSPCAGTIQPYSKYEWSSYTMDDVPVPIDVLKTGNSKCVEINYDSEYFDTFWHETQVPFKVKLKVWDRLDDYSTREFYVTVSKPIRLEVPLVRTVCSGSSMVFNNGLPMLSGGSGDFTYQWNNTQYFNDNFNASSPDPQLDLPENGNGSVTYGLLVTDNITGCTLFKNLTINFGSISINAGPDIYTCIGPSLKKLGLPDNEIMVTGGDGNYTYEWNSSIGFENLSNLQSLRPTVKAVDNVPVTYYLEVRDGSGCYAKDEVVVTGGHEPNFVADAGIDKTICYGSDAQIAGNSIAGGMYKWEVSPSQTLKKDNESILLLTGGFTKNAGSYTLKYTISDNIGCFSQDEMELTVADQWKYIGFEPGISYIIPHPPLDNYGEVFDKVKPGLTQLPTIYTIADNKGSGAVAPFTYSWSDPAVENKIVQNSKVVSLNGYLQKATITNPEEKGYTIKVTDAIGCTMNFHSNYFLKHEGQASMEVTTMNGEYFQCSDAKLQFKVVYKTGYTGSLPTKLPQQLNVEFDVQKWKVGLMTGDFGQFYKQGEISNAFLKLTNSKAGIYEGIITLKKNSGFFDQQSPFFDCNTPGPFNGDNTAIFFKLYVKATVPNLNIGVAKFNTYISNNIPLLICFPMKTITGPCTIPDRIWGQKAVAIGSSSSCGAGDLRVINGGQCDVRVGYADTNPEGIHLRNKIEVEEGSYFHAYIEPLCSGQNYKPVKNPVIIEDELPITNAVPQAYHKDGLLYPNPTTGKITLKRLNDETRSSIINTISVYDIMGKQVKYFNLSQDWSQSIELDVTHLKPGAYFIELISAIGEIYRFNFVKIEN